MPPTPKQGWEVWCANHTGGYKKWLPRVVWEDEWTRWFQLHSRQHFSTAKHYRKDVEWYKAQTKPIYFQKHQPDIPSSRPFPFSELIQAFSTRYFTCTAAWLTALAIYEGFSRIEYHGIEIGKHKPLWGWERPCVFYWINLARSRGIEVWYPPHLDWDLSEAGDPSSYTGPLYGLQTKPELT